MKTLLLSITVLASSLFTLTSSACPDCLPNIDPSDKNSILTCLVTITVGAVIRYIEKRQIKIRSKRDKKNEGN